MNIVAFPISLTLNRGNGRLQETAVTMYDNGVLGDELYV